MNNLENKDILADNILNVIDIIINKIPTAVFGGSIALNAVGLLNRKINDIDLFFPLGTNLTLNGFLELSNIDGSETVTNVNGIEIQRTSAKIHNVKVCCFKVAKLETQHSLFTFLGRTIRIQNVNYAIQAKIAYANKDNKLLVSQNEVSTPKNKHNSDMDWIDEILNTF